MTQAKTLPVNTSDGSVNVTLAGATVPGAKIVNWHTFPVIQTLSGPALLVSGITPGGGSLPNGTIKNQILQWDGSSWPLTFGMQLGKGAIAPPGTGSIAYGEGAQAGINSSIAMGYKQVSVEGAIAIGYANNLGTGATGKYSVVAGIQNKINSGANAIIYGLGCESGGGLSVVFGQGAKATGNRSQAFGYQSVASGAQSFAVGWESTASNSNAIAISGKGAIASGDASTALGLYTKASGSNTLALSSYANATANSAIAAGLSSIASGVESLAFGPMAHATTDQSIAMGKAAVAAGTQTIAIGSNTITKGINSVAVGSNVSAQGDYSVAIGAGTNADVSAISIGWAIKNKTNADAVAIALYMTNPPAADSVAIGARIASDGAGSVAVGKTASAAGQRSIAVGFGSHTAAKSSGAVAIGNGVNAAGINSLALIGNALGNGSTAIGNGSSTTAKALDGMAIGYGATTDAEEAVQIGKGTNSKTLTLQFIDNTIANMTGIVTKYIDVDQPGFPSDKGSLISCKNDQLWINTDGIRSWKGFKIHANPSKPDLNPGEHRNIIKSKDINWQLRAEANNNAWVSYAINENETGTLKIFEFSPTNTLHLTFFGGGLQHIDTKHVQIADLTDDSILINKTLNEIYGVNSNQPTPCTINTSAIKGRQCYLIFDDQDSNAGSWNWFAFLPFLFFS